MKEAIIEKIQISTNRGVSGETLSHDGKIDFGSVLIELMSVTSISLDYSMVTFF